MQERVLDRERRLRGHRLKEREVLVRVQLLRNLAADDDEAEELIARAERDQNRRVERAQRLLLAAREPVPAHTLVEALERERAPIVLRPREDVIVGMPRVAGGASVGIAGLRRER